MNAKRNIARWTTADDISVEVEKLWNSGQLPSALVSGRELFPYSIKLKGPTSCEMAERLSDICAWNAALEACSKKVRQRSYKLEYRRIRHNIIGENDIPCQAVVETAEDAIALAGKKKEARMLLKLTGETLKRFPAIVGYIYKKPLLVLSNAENWMLFLSVCEWLLAHQRPCVYIREMNVRGVHTKFVEAHKKILGELLDLVLPQCAIDMNYTAGANFEKRYGFKVKDDVVRMRLPIGCALFPATIEDISLCGEEFAATQIPCNKVLIVENQITFLALPRMSGVLMILGAGYGFDAIKNAVWLKEKEIFYWGDIDTHGFAILSGLRCSFPKVHSLLMDDETFDEYSNMCVEEPKPVKFLPERLTSDEVALFRRLHTTDGKNLRLEQERISMEPATHILQRVLG